jgi:hypothetical protein
MIQNHESYKIRERLSELGAMDDDLDEIMSAVDMANRW